MFKVIIAGCRDFTDYQTLYTYCEKVLSDKQDICIISGCCSGADELGIRYAKEKGYEIIRMPADWNAYGKAAGPIRNRKMAENADALIAFWDGKSRGTKNMIETAKALGLQIRIKQYSYD